MHITSIKQTENNLKNNTNFGALKIEPSALSVINKQANKLGENYRTVFLDRIKSVQEEQKNNSCNIILKKCKFRNALQAVVIEVDTIFNKIFTKTFSQPFFNKNGNLDFLEKANLQASNVKSSELKLPRKK